eukprot:CAMPEP_0115435966 /NCGR_PEP_ID=MMETSP0271-20121206/33937_1 /TAXON_ID=71861 /ORGANISM="Scrippsiella trochoidea, Strain CCMP3099" /LENGTH=34 /DNA_ID= /DNA_START= /DNA_END= /DNA_ORIENTATION=
MSAAEADALNSCTSNRHRHHFSLVLCALSEPELT